MVDLQGFSFWANCMSPKLEKRRIDEWLFKLEFVDSREKAKRLVLAGKVKSSSRTFTKPSILITEEEAQSISVEEPMKYVSRGGQKLEGAFEKWNILVQGLVCLDVGSSTGGFTDCLLQKGAKKVFAIDNGTNQLAWKLRTDERVISLEKTDIRKLESLPEAELAEFCCVDVSFISLKSVLPHLPKFLKNESNIIALLKPQFEVGRENIAKGGIVKDPQVHEALLQEFSDWLKENFRPAKEFIPSPITGTDGNKEYLFLL